MAKTQGSQTPKKSSSATSSKVAMGSTASKKSPKSSSQAKGAEKPTSKSSAKAPAAKPPKATSKPQAPKTRPAESQPPPQPSRIPSPHTAKPAKLTPFLKKQRQRLLELKDSILDAMNGVARDSLRTRAEGNEASAFGMHQADAGSDAYDREFALNLLSKEQDVLYEIDEALKRIEMGTYGICEMSGKPIPQARLEALPFTRYTVECQAELEKMNRFRNIRQPVTSLFGGSDDSEEESEDELADTKD